MSGGVDILSPETEFDKYGMDVDMFLGLIKGLPTRDVFHLAELMQASSYALPNNLSIYAPPQVKIEPTVLAKTLQCSIPKKAAAFTPRKSQSLTFKPPNGRSEGLASPDGGPHALTPRRWRNSVDVPSIEGVLATARGRKEREKNGATPSGDEENTRAWTPLSAFGRRSMRGHFHLARRQRHVS